jgi:hypothetical protein
MSNFTAFADASTSIGIVDLTVENGTDTVAIYGTLNITRDKAGLAAAVKLKVILDGMVAGLQAMENLPHVIDAPPKPKTLKNPFA